MVTPILCAIDHILARIAPEADVNVAAGTPPSTTSAAFTSLPSTATLIDRFVALRRYLASVCLSTAASSQRKPLTKVAKAASIKEFTPSFNEFFRPGKDLDTDKERVEVRKLTKKLKREKKGALREVRRDTQFVAQERRKQQEYADAKRAEQKKATRTMLDREMQDTNLMAKVSRKKFDKNRAQGKK